MPRILQTTLLACCTATLAVLPSCNNKPTVDPEMVEQLEKAEKARTRVETEFKAFREDADKRYGEVMKQLDEVQKSTDKLKEDLEAAKDEAAKRKLELQEYMQKYKISQRSKMKGLQIPVVKMSDDQTYTSVSIREVTPIDVAVTHSSGVTRLPMAKLPSDLQKQFLYDPNEEKDYADALAEVQKAEAEAGAAAQSTPGKKGSEEYRPNPVVVRNLRQRIQTRLNTLEEIAADSNKLSKSAYAATSLAKERQNTLGRRRSRIEEDIKILRNMLERELSGKKD